jgi:hypothetical protein
MSLPLDPPSCQADPLASLRATSESSGLRRSGSIESEDVSNLWRSSSTARAEEEELQQGLKQHAVRRHQSDRGVGTSRYYPSREDLLSRLPPDLSLTQIFEQAEISQWRRREVEQRYHRRESSRSLPPSWTVDGTSIASSTSLQSQRDYQLPYEQYHAPPQEDQFRDGHRYQAFELERLRLSSLTLESEPTSNDPGANCHRSSLPDLDQTSCNSTSHHDNTEWNWRQGNSGSIPYTLRHQEEHPSYLPPPSSSRGRHQELPNEPRAPQQRQQVTSPQPQSSNSSTVSTVEITPGQFLPLRGAEETSQAFERGHFVIVPCLICNGKLQCIADCELVLCPDCRAVSPNTEDFDGKMSCSEKEDPYRRYKRGVGLGLKV